MASGLFVCFSGRRLRVSPYVTGFLAVSSVCTIIAWNAEPKDAYGQRNALYIGIWVGTGIAGAVIFAALRNHIEPVEVGFFGFVFLGLWFCSLANGGTVRTTVARSLLFIASAVIPAVLSLFVAQLAGHIAFAFGGGFVALLGLDLLVRTGVFDAVGAFVALGPGGEKATGAYVLDARKQVVVASTAGVGLLGFIVQWGWERWARRRKQLA
ncbi:hypothetical protein HDU96_008032 [Phlyctochytrium bullatum]|nr:hypothetical protein HDU96_008032 [Phlyctochytrium bullatum]